MGFFDPAHKKILDRAPLAFQESAKVWGAIIESYFAMRPPLNENIVRALVVGMMALRYAERATGLWSRDAVQFTTGIVNNAYRALTPADRELATHLFSTVVLTTEGEEQDDMTA